MSINVSNAQKMRDFTQKMQSRFRVIDFITPGCWD